MDSYILHINQLARRAYAPGLALPDALSAFASAFIERFEATRALISLSAHGTLDVRRTGHTIETDWRSGVDDDPLDPMQRGDASSSTVTAALPYGPARIGALLISLASSVAANSEQAALCQLFAQECAFLVKRYEVDDWARRTFDLPMMMSGISPAIRRVELFVEKAAWTRLPVLLRGRHATEKLHIAAAIHCCGPDREREFIEVQCNALQPSDITDLLPRWFDQARGGTLLFNRIGELPLTAQRPLLQLLRSLVGQSVSAEQRRAETRIIACSTADIHRRAVNSRFVRALLTELNFLPFTVPSFSDLQDAERESGDSTRGRRGSRVTGDIDGREHPGLARTSASGAEWARRIVNRDFTGLEYLHEGVQRALRFLGDHYRESISLGQVARHACLSTSHLSYLLKSALGLTFKPFLGHMRIEKARQLLAADVRLRITDVALDVGFNDLSHFQKLFRRLTDVSPSEFRAACRANLPADS